MRYIQAVWQWVKNHKWWTAAAVVVVVIVGMVMMRNGDPAVSAVAVERGDVISEVSVTGTVKPAQSIDLAFERSGRITSIPVAVGQAIYRGQTLAQLENGDLYAQVQQAEAALAELEKGSRPEEIRAKELAMISAEQTLDAYYQDAYNDLQDAYVVTNDAVRNKTDALFSNDESDSPQLTYTSTNSQAEIDAKINRVKARQALIQWKAELDVIQGLSDRVRIENALLSASGYMRVATTLLTNLQDTLENPPGLSQTTIDSYKTNINTGKSAVTSAIGSVDNGAQLIRSQIIAVATAENALSLIRTGATEETIAAQEAQVAYYRSQLARTIISAPFSGTITKIAQDSGEIATAGVPVVSVIGGSRYTIEANVTESDIAKVAAGKTATATLDAYGSDVLFDAEVVKVDIGSTVIEGVATYKTTLQFIQEDDRILPGLTADVDILNDKKEGVLYVPTRNIFTTDGQKFVTVQTKEGSEERAVETGLRGSDGRTEIISGLEEGEMIIAE